MAGPVSARSSSRRFTLVYFLLAAIAGAAVAVFLVLGFGDDNSSTADAGGAPAVTTGWSAWRPVGNDLGAVHQIATYVSGHYKLPDGSQLVLVTGDLPGVAERIDQNGTPTVGRAPIYSFAVPADTKGSYSIEQPVAVEYQLCGTGDGCAVPGKPSVKRGALLQREALELALYSFQYLPIDAVVVLYPPAPNQAGKLALYFHRQDFARELSAPLSATLNPATTLKPGAIPKAENTIVQALVAPQVYSYRYILQPDGTSQMVLSDPNATPPKLAPSAGG
jgi:hypothetical protein